MDAISTGILHTNNMIDFELEPKNYIYEVEFYPNWLLAPKFGIPFRPEQSQVYPLKLDKVLKWMKEGLKKKGGRGISRKEEQLSLLPCPAPIFGGISYLKGGWEEKVRDKLTRSVDKIIKEIWPKFEGTPYLDSGKELPMGDIGEKSFELIKKSKTCIFEVTTSNPSVYSELGIALALLKPSIMIWNIRERPFDYQQIVDFLQNIELFRYSGVRNIDRLVEDIIRFGSLYDGKVKSAWFYAREPQFRLEEESNTYALLYGRNSDITSEIEEGLSQRLYESFKIKPLREIPSEVKKLVKLAEICYKLHVAQYIIIETSFNTPETFFMYGYAKALGKNIFMLHKEGTPEPPTMWRKKREDVWKHSKDLIEKVWKFIKDVKEEQ
jgi:nucleoside 2-deoxyribosyltransferase